MFYDASLRHSELTDESSIAPSSQITNGLRVQYIPRNMHTVFALLCFVVVIHWLIFPYPSGLLHWHCGNLTIAPVPAKQPWWIWINTSYEFIMNDCITTTKQSTTKPCAYFMGYTVCMVLWLGNGLVYLSISGQFRQYCLLRQTCDSVITCGDRPGGDWGKITWIPQLFIWQNKITQQRRENTLGVILYVFIGSTDKIVDTNFCLHV